MVTLRPQCLFVRARDVGVLQQKSATDKQLGRLKGRGEEGNRGKEFEWFATERKKPTVSTGEITQIPPAPGTIDLPCWVSTDVWDGADIRPCLFCFVQGDFKICTVSLRFVLGHHDRLQITANNRPTSWCQLAGCDCASISEQKQQSTQNPASLFDKIIEQNRKTVQSMLDLDDVLPDQRL